LSDAYPSAVSQPDAAAHGAGFGQRLTKAVLGHIGIPARKQPFPGSGMLRPTAGIQPRTFMTLFERLRYSLYLVAIGGAVIILVISIASADMVGWLPASADKIALSPFFLFALYLLAYLLAPLASRRFPIVRNRS
jgi:hypothetical protein